MLVPAGPDTTMTPPMTCEQARQAVDQARQAAEEARPSPAPEAPAATSPELDAAYAATTAQERDQADIAAGEVCP